MKKLLFIFLLILSSCKSTKDITKSKPEIDKDLTTSTQCSDETIEEKITVSSKYVISSEEKIIINNYNKAVDKNKALADRKTKNSNNDNIKNTEPVNNKGVIAYSFPTDEMKVAYKYKVTLRITKDSSTQSIKTLVIGDRNIPISDPSIDSKVSIEDIRVEKKMSAYLLSDSSFSIVSLNSEFQEIENTGYTEWSWIVSPLKGGKSYIKMIIKIEIKNDDETNFKDIIVFDKNIEVKSNIEYSLKSWFDKYWQWLSTTIVIPFIIWFYKRRNEKNKN